ncbi:MAG: HD family phosphohydrolase [Pseudomonadota bacterium]
MMTRQEALALVEKHKPEQFLIYHAVATEAVMRGLATHFGEDCELWGLTGLLHDIDFPATRDVPAEHGVKAMELIGDGLPEEGLAAIRAHNYECNGHVPTTRFDTALRCGETVTGLISAAALVRPTGMEGMKASSLKKKMKDKAFAASVNRDCIRECEKIGLELGDFLNIAIAAMTDVSAEIGLARSV